MAKRKCKQCNEVFEKKQPLQYVCSISCSIAYSKAKEKQKKDKEWRKEKQERKKAIMTHSDWLNLLQPKVNALARAIDNGNNCMMCDKPLSKGRDAIHGCHYHSVGSNAYTRFNLFNIWAGCYSCNKSNSSNIIGYDEMLIQTYGKEKWEYIKFTIKREARPLKLSIPQIEEAIPIISKLIKELSNKSNRTPLERWELRDSINDKLGLL